MNQEADRPNSWRSCECPACWAFNAELVKLGPFPEGGGWDEEAELPIVTPEQDAHAHRVWVLTAKHPCEHWSERVKQTIRAAWGRELSPA